MTTTQQIEPTYVLDTNVLIWVLKKKTKLSMRVAAIFEAATRGETHLVIPAIVVAELFYSNKKWSLFDDFNKVYAEMKAKPYFRFVDLTPEDALDFEIDKAIPEMHDRIIVGVARRLNCPLITADSTIIASGIVRVVR